jgi:hypothetical protein
MGHRGNTGRCWLAVALLGLGAGGAAAQHPAAVKVQELFEQARPHAEAVLGARLERAPQFRCVSADEYQRQPDPDLEAYLRYRYGKTGADAFARAVEVTRYVAAGAAVARHAEGTDVIFVLPENLAAIASWDPGLKGANSLAFLQLALVHETMRMVLDSRYHLAKMRGDCRDAEEFLAFQAVVEGRAHWLTMEVARKMGTARTFPLLSRCLLHVPDTAPDPALRAMSQTALRQRCWALTAGAEFFNRLHDKRLADAERRAFTRPPRQLRWIEKPDLYIRAEQSNRRDLAAVLRTLEPALPANEWAAAQQAFTPAMVKQVGALLLEKQRAERAVGTWDEGRSLVWVSRQDARRQVAVSVVRHETAAGARSYFGFAVDLQRKQDALTEKCPGPKIRVLDSKATSLKIAGADEAVRNDKRMLYGEGSEPIPVSMVLARSGDVVVECSWHGLSAEPEWAERVVQAVLSGTK